MTEMELIQLLTKKIPRQKGDLKMGVGDDCSVIRIGKKDVLISCDSLVENIHFKRKWAPWETWGHKAAATALSDIAAMGGTPRYAWVDLSIPKNMKSSEVQKFYKGFFKIMKRFKAVIAGGNISKSPKCFSATTTVWGEVAAGKAMLRKNAKPGDKVYISGPVGLAPFKPMPQIKLGRQLVKKGCRSAIDVSDGLLQDLHHIAQASKVKIILQAKKIPHKGTLKEALTKGEDYILAFFSKQPIGAGHLLVGEVKKGRSGVEVIDKKGHSISFQKLGFQHKIT